MHDVLQVVKNRDAGTAGSAGRSESGVEQNVDAILPAVSGQPELLPQDSLRTASRANRANHNLQTARIRKSFRGLAIDEQQDLMRKGRVRPRVDQMAKVDFGAADRPGKQIQRVDPDPQRIPLS